MFPGSLVTSNTANTQVNKQLYVYVNKIQLRKKSIKLKLFNCGDNANMIQVISCSGWHTQLVQCFRASPGRHPLHLFNFQIMPYLLFEATYGIWKCKCSTDLIVWIIYR